MLSITYPVAALLNIVWPVFLGFALRRRYQLAWRLFVVGGLAFMGSQVVHIPLNIGLTVLFQQGFLPVPPVEYRLVFNAVLLGLTAGLCEEVARWLTYRFVLKSARAWKEALMVGAGHGGFEAMLIGAGSLVAFFAFSSALKADPSTLPAAAQAQLAAYWSQPDFLPLVGVLERVFAICTHLALSVLVLQAFTRRNNLYLAVAILAHAVVDATAVYAVATWGVIVTEGIVAVYAVAAVALILVLRPPATPSSPA